MPMPVSPLTEEMNYLIGVMGMSPEEAAIMTGAEIPSAMDLPSSSYSGLSEDAQRAIAELKNLDETRNAGERNRSFTPPEAPPMSELEGYMDEWPVRPGEGGVGALEFVGPDMYEMGSDLRGIASEAPGFAYDVFTGRPAGKLGRAVYDRLPSIPEGVKDAASDLGAGLTGGDRPDRPDRYGMDTGTTLNDFSLPGDIPGMTAGAPLTEIELPPFVERPAPSSPGAGTGVSGNPSRSVNTELTTVDTVETKPNPMNPVQSFFADKFGMDEDTRSDLGRALLMGGLATMAGTSPYAAENIGKGGLVGAQAYFDAGDERREAGLAEEDRQMQREKFELEKQRLAQQIRSGEISIEQAEARLAGGGVDDLEFDSPAGKLWADANRIASRTPGVTAEEVIQTWIDQGWYKDPREAEF